MPIDIVFSLNAGYMTGLLAAINSIIKNTAHGDRLRFHLITPKNEQQIFAKKLWQYFPQYSFSFGEFVPDPDVADYIEQKYKPPTQDKRNAVSMLFTRLFLKQIFPAMTKAIHIDADVIVLKDIAELFDTTKLSASQYFSAVPNFLPAVFHFTNPLAVWQELQQFKQTFNAGVICTDLQFWTDTDAERIKYYLELDAQHQYRLFQLNDETILNLLFKDYLQLPAQWNCSGYGNWQFVANILRKELSEIGILHWSGGHHKPWSSPQIVYGEIWQKYAIL